MQSSSLPRTIWMYWQQGESSCPPLVKNCVDSWRYLNPEWEVKVLDKTTARSLVDLQDYEFRDDIGIQMYSDIIRIKLLSEFGGVWADASLFCSQPLDDWLPNYLADDFFAFASHRNDRLMTNWFLQEPYCR